MQNLEKIVLFLRPSPTIDFAVRIRVWVPVFADMRDVSPIAWLRVPVYIWASLSGRDPKQPEQITMSSAAPHKWPRPLPRPLALPLGRFLAQALSGFGLTMSRFSKQKRPSSRLFCKFGQSGAGLLRSREKVPIY